LQRYPHRGPVAGAFGSTVGLISLGMVGRTLCQLLRHFELRVIAYDPFATPEVAAGLNVTLCTLEEVFQVADVVSLHTLLLDATRGMITGAHFRAMKRGATFINTARGAVVREPEMVAALQEHPDLFAVLDVTDPEPPQPGSPLYTLPNVVLTPHIARALDGECRRMGRAMVEELGRYLRGEALRWAISRERAATLA
jgi:phosphoglycerate dehydrogenase-like enzyme